MIFKYVFFDYFDSMLLSSLVENESFEGYFQLGLSGQHLLHLLNMFMKVWGLKKVMNLIYMYHPYFLFQIIHAEVPLLLVLHCGLIHLATVLIKANHLATVRASTKFKIAHQWVQNPGNGKVLQQPQQLSLQEMTISMGCMGTTQISKMDTITPKKLWNSIQIELR